MRTIPLGPAAVALAAVALAALPGCAVEHHPTTAQGGAGAQPGLVRSFMASDLAYRPIPPERLADPAIRAAAEACERAGGQHCREYVTPTAERQSFRKGVDPKAVAILQLGRLPAGVTTFETTCRFVDPAGSSVTTLRNPITAPPGMPPWAVLTTSCVMNLMP